VDGARDARDPGRAARHPERRGGAPRELRASGSPRTSSRRSAVARGIGADSRAAWLEAARLAALKQMGTRGIAWLDAAGADGRRARRPRAHGALADLRGAPGPAPTPTPAECGCGSAAGSDPQP
jgi:hypothetical protein